jgi:ketosteroid isomerase-like protein
MAQEVNSAMSYRLREEGKMIGSIIAKRKVRSAFAMLNRGEIDSFFANWADDAVWNYPTNVSVGGKIQGKKAIIEWWKRWIEQIPKRNFVLMNVCVRDVFSFSATNVVAVEWSTSMTNKEGKDFSLEGVTVIDIENFKAIRETDYICDPATVKRIWGEA